MHTALVSVIVPVYNVRKFLCESLESVINQTYPNLEIIIVDDGSTDGSGKICDEYEARDSRITVIHQENLGLSGARNAGLNAMTGDIVAFLDSDDAFHPEMLQRMVATMQENDTDVVICSYSPCRTNGIMPVSKIGLKEASTVLYDRKDVLRALLSGKIDWYAWNKIYRKEIFETVRYPLGQVYEDIDTTYDILDSAKRVAVLEEPLIMYRRREESITGEYTLSSARDRIHSYELIEKKVLKNSPEIFGEQHKQWIDRRILNVLLETYARCGATAKSYGKDIIEIGKKLNLKECDHRTKRFLYEFRISPGLFKTMYLTSMYVKRDAHAVIDRFGTLRGRKENIK